MLSSIGLAAAVVTLAVPTSAGAATQIGETFDPGNFCPGPYTIVQSKSPGATYAWS